MELQYTGEVPHMEGVREEALPQAVARSRRDSAHGCGSPDQQGLTLEDSRRLPGKPRHALEPGAWRAPAHRSMPRRTWRALGVSLAQLLGEEKRLRPSPSRGRSA